MISRTSCSKEITVIREWIKAYEEENEFLKSELKKLKLENEKFKIIKKEKREIGKNFIKTADNLLNEKNPQRETLIKLVQACRDFVEKVYFKKFQ
jgi:N-acetylglutamate synthase-like GNAT family acetyltransferase